MMSPAPLSPALAGKYQSLQAAIAQHQRVVVAFSGGIDSSLVAYVAGAVLGENAVAVTSGSASLKRSDLALAEQLAGDWGLRHRVIYTDELSKAEYRANPVNRCFHCKTSLYEALTAIAEDEQIETILNGTNIDDLGDHRPGLQAAANYSVRAPLADCGFDKADIRALAEHLGLENAQKPQSACLSSRFPYGTAINAAKLAQVEGAEAFLASLGFTQFRVRHHQELARLELLPEEFALAAEHGAAITQALTTLGYRFVTLDLKGFRSGSLNEGLSDAQRAQADASGKIAAVQIYSGAR